MGARGPGDSPEGDAVVASGSGLALAVLTADCAPVALGSPEGVHGAVHVGWRGLVAGSSPGPSTPCGRSVPAPSWPGSGPCIGPCCYEFSRRRPRGRGWRRTGPRCVGTTTGGARRSTCRPRCVVELARSGVSDARQSGQCTVCTPGYFSHRGRGDEARQALFVWRSVARPPGPFGPTGPRAGAARRGGGGACGRAAPADRGRRAGPRHRAHRGRDEGVHVECGGRGTRVPGCTTSGRTTPTSSWPRWRRCQSRRRQGRSLTREVGL